MNVEPLHEPISVLAKCSAGAVEPLRFRWGAREYRVEAINGRWIDRDADGLRLHYSVQCGEETYWIHFDTHELQWWMDKTISN